MDGASLRTPEIFRHVSKEISILHRLENGAIKQIGVIIGGGAKCNFLNLQEPGPAGREIRSADREIGRPN